MTDRVKVVGADPGSELAVLTLALEGVEPGGMVVYHSGPVGSAPTSMKRAAMALFEAGKCILVHQVPPIDPDAEPTAFRTVDYCAIRTRGFLT